MSEEAKREARMQRNRESAQLSRQRKKAQTGGLERQCQELQAHNAHLTGEPTAMGTLGHDLKAASRDRVFVSQPCVNLQPSPHW